MTHYQSSIEILKIGGKRHVQLGKFSDLRGHHSGNARAEQRYVHVERRALGLQKIVSV